MRVPKEGDVDRPTELVPGSFLVEATAPAPEGDHVPATMAIGDH